MKLLTPFLSLLSLPFLTTALAAPARAFAVSHSRSLHPRQNTTAAPSSASIKSSDGRCLFIDPSAGDFRKNLIPVALKACDGSAGEKFDFVTSGKHNDQAGQTLVVSTVTQGCLNFDPRRAANDQVIIFSCGGRADGEGQVTNSQLFAFTAGQTSLALKPQNGNGATCLVPQGARLGSAACDNAADQTFTIG